MAGELHPMARRFADVADVYERARPGYPDALAELLRSRLGVGPGTRALDVGAGTGKLTRVLLATGADVRAAEPVAEMRALLAHAIAPVWILDARAESLPLAAGSLDLIAAGDAWHWFDGERAPAEFARLLTSGGELLIAQHAPFPGQRGTWRAELQGLLRSVRGDHPFFVRDNGRRALADHDAFGPLRNLTVAHHHEVDRGGLVDHVRSMSCVAALDRGRWDEVIAQTRAIAERAPARISVSYAIDLWVTRRV